MGELSAAWGLADVAFVYGIRSMGHALHGLLSGQLWAIGISVDSVSAARIEQTNGTA